MPTTAPRPTSTGTARDARAEQQREHERDPRQATLEEARRAASRCRTVTPRTNAAALSAPRPDERHLAERQLPGPAGEHRHRDRAEGEGQMMAHVCWFSDFLPRQRQDTAGPEPDERDQLRQPAHHQMCRNRSGTAGTRGAKAKLSPPISSLRLIRATRISTMIRSTNCLQPGLVREVEEDDLVEQPGSRPRRSRRGERVIRPTGPRSCRATASADRAAPARRSSARSRTSMIATAARKPAIVQSRSTSSSG